MSLSINIDKNTCIKCGKCVRICPAHIFIQESPAGDIGLQHVSTCIKCGHCVGVCPTFSVIHSVFPANKVHPINPEELPTSAQVMTLIKSRRSNRAFSKKPVPMELLDDILEAAHRAPTASNMQQVEFTLITDPEKIRQVIDLTIEIFTDLSVKLENKLLKPILKKVIPDAYKYLGYIHRLQDEHRKGNDPILRKATSLILIHTPKSSRFGCQDSNLAYQNASLMAESLGVNQFYTGFLCTALQQDKKNRIPELLGITGTVHAGMAMGMPSFKFENYIDKEDIKVTKF